MALTKVQIRNIFENAKITIDDMEAVASSPKLKGFDSINLSGKGITDEIGLLLINSAYICNLVELDLSENSLTNDFVKALIESSKAPKLEKTFLVSNYIKSSAIPSLVEKFGIDDEDFDDDPRSGCREYVCGIAIYYNGDNWIRLYDAAKQELIHVGDFEDFQHYEDESYGGIVSIEDFYWVYNESSDDADDAVFFDNLSKARVAFNKIKAEAEDEAEDEEEDEAEDENEVVVYDPLNLSEKEEKERASYIAEVEKQCRVRAKELGLPGVEAQKLAEDVRLEMVLIPAGTFLMGSPASEKGRHDGETQHEVTLTQPFYMGKYEVTQEQWEAVIGHNPSIKTKGAKFPVTDVSWGACQAFIKKLNAKTNGRYRLPSEAEWEYACRAGTSTAYSVGDEITPKDANYAGSKIEKPVAVGSYRPNAFGLYDMHGNVSEWCEDGYARYPDGAVTDTKGAATGIGPVVRGGSFRSDVSKARSSNRSFGTTAVRTDSNGFRLARTP